MQDWYVFAVILGTLGLIASAIGWTIETWPHLAQQWADRKRSAREFQVVGNRLIIPRGSLRVGDRVRFTIPAPNGTVQNPRDPSPRPRNSRR